MTLEDKIEVISKLFIQNIPNVFCESKRFFFNSNAFVSSIEAGLNSKGIQFDKQPDKVLIKIRSFLDDLNIIPFSSIERLFDGRLINESYLILNTNGDYLYSNNDSKLWGKNVSERFRVKCLNVISYYRLFNLLR
ncbi:MAG TPA: hypothetical protein DHV26_14460, partial [Cytophagales bacterium]|nr:hypothetical protein [Cytophagales bacterium]